MKIHTRVLTTILPLVLLAGSCVTQERYQQALADQDYYRKAYQDLESFQGQLEAENARLRGELELYEGTPIAANAVRDIDERLQALQRLTDGISEATGDVTVLSIDGGYGLRLTDAILFDSGSVEIKPEGRELLQKPATEINSRPFVRLWVRGHTDSDPVVRAETRQRFPKGNLQLSSERALEVAALLKESGLPGDRIVVAGFGPSEPLSANDSSENKRKNRRVELFVLEKETSGS